MTTDAILAELRTLRGAPDSLRERVRALPEPKPRFAWTLPRIDVRRSLLVLAPAVVALAVGSAALHGVLSDGTNARQQPLALESTVTTAAAPTPWRAAKASAAGNDAGSGSYVFRAGRGRRRRAPAEHDAAQPLRGVAACPRRA